MEYKGGNRGWLGFLILIALICVGVVVWNRLSTPKAQEYSVNDFRRDLAQGYVSSVEIEQNQEVPTGVVYVTGAGRMKFF